MAIMPVRSAEHCPACGARLERRPGGRCPVCRHDVRAHVARRRHREERIEQVVAVLATLMVLGLALLAGGCSLAEGVLAYAAAGALVWWWAKRTF